MSGYDWMPFLTQWSREIVHSKAFADFLEYNGDDYPGLYTPDVIASEWLGYPGASEEQIATAEIRLGVKLPPDYRAFLQATNGWRYIGPFIPRMWGAEDLNWLRITDPDLVAIWTSNPGAAVYGSVEGLHETRYIGSTLRISDQEIAGTAIYLLNPDVVNPAGEWEAWFMAHWVPGAVVYPSFWEMMHAEHETFLDLKDQ